MIHLISYGARKRSKPACDLSYDVRRWCHVNPHALFGKRIDGRDARVIQWMMQRPDMGYFVSDMAEEIAGKYVDGGKKKLTVAICCSWGHHRSVAVVELLKLMVAAAGPVVVTHLELGT